MLRRKLKKALYSAVRPRLWKALAAGVAPTIEHIDALSLTPFRTIVDVGANRGQFVLFCREHHPQAMVHAFEPLKVPADIFERLFAGDPQVKLRRTAIGSSSGQASIHITNRDGSSSLLTPGILQERIFGAHAVSTATIPVARLDECIGPADLVAPALLKIDVQGAELGVLKGAAALLPLFDAVFVECSFIELYEGQTTACDVIRELDHAGFRIRGVFNQHVDARHGPVQADFLFHRALGGT